MGSLIAVSASPALESPQELFRRCFEAAECSTHTDASSTVNAERSFAASFPRRNGSHHPIAHDPRTGSWLAAIGSFFHESGHNTPDALLAQYLAQDAERLGRSLEGFFAIVIGDAVKGEISVITDVIGSCHLFARQLRGAVVLSSSSRMLASLEDISLDPLACHEFLSTGIIYEDRTIYNEVRKLPPASVITYRNGQEVARGVYWDISALSPNSLPGKTATEALWHSLLSATKKITSQFPRISCDLTGGYDSRAVLAAFVGAGANFTTVVSGPENNPDVLISRGLAKKLGLEHIHNLPCDYPSAQELTESLRLTDGEYDIVEYSSIERIHSKLSQSFDISVNGSFGEVARGYWWELLVPHTGQRRKLDSRKLARLRYAYCSSNDLFQNRFRIDLVDHVTAVINRTIGDLIDYPNIFQMDAAYLRMRMQRWQGRIASSTNRIWPCISPFMFRSVLEVMLQAECSVRQRSLLIREMLSKFQPAIAAFPLEHGYPAIPATLATFMRFWPIIPGYARKAFRKLVRRQQTVKGPSNGTSDLTTAATREIAERLVSGLDQDSQLFDREALDAFLKASQRPDFSRHAEWNRLFSLTSALKRETCQG